MNNKPINPLRWLAPRVIGYSGATAGQNGLWVILPVLRRYASIAVICTVLYDFTRPET
jgi:hypothetical protein